MNNNLSAIMPKILARGLLSLRELCMMPRLVNGSYGADAKMKGDTINVPIPTAQAATDVVPGPTPPAPTDNTLKTVPIKLDQWKSSKFGLTDQDLQNIDENAAFLPMQTMEAVRAIANAVNAHIFSKYKGSGLAAPGVFGYTGTAGTTPFSVSDADAVNLRKTLARQLCPKDNRRAVLDFDAEANALSLASFKDVSQVGSNTVKIDGEVGRKFGIDWYADDIVPTHTAGTGSGYVINQAVTAPAIGDTSVTVGTGTGTILQGDILTFAGQTQTYVCTVALAANVVSFYPPLKAAITNGAAVTLKASHVVNLGFHRDAFAFANRPMDSSQAIAAGAQIISMADPDTGIVMRLELSRQYKQVMWELDMLWGAEIVRPELAARLAG